MWASLSRRMLTTLLPHCGVAFAGLTQSKVATASPKKKRTTIRCRRAGKKALRVWKKSGEWKTGDILRFRFENRPVRLEDAPMILNIVATIGYYTSVFPAQPVICKTAGNDCCP